VPVSVGELRAGISMTRVDYSTLAVPGRVSFTIAYWRERCSQLLLTDSFANATFNFERNGETLAATLLLFSVENARLELQIRQLGKTKTLCAPKNAARIQCQSVCIIGFAFEGVNMHQ
jgi:hypothetical protein